MNGAVGETLLLWLTELADCDDGESCVFMIFKKASYHIQILSILFLWDDKQSIGTVAVLVMNLANGIFKLQNSTYSLLLFTTP